MVVLTLSPPQCDVVGLLQSCKPFLCDTFMNYFFVKTCPPCNPTDVSRTFHAVKASSVGDWCVCFAVLIAVFSLSCDTEAQHRGMTQTQALSAFNSCSTHSSILARVRSSLFSFCRLSIIITAGFNAGKLLFPTLINPFLIQEPFIMYSCCN